MPKVEIDYSNTIIYKITCKDESITDVYVGHTTNFVQRKHAHKQACNNSKSTNHDCKLYKVIRANGGWQNWNMEIINFFKCNDHYEARKKEQEYFISLNATLNSMEPMPKPKEIKNLVLSNPTEIQPDINSYKFVCENCNYNTCNKKDFNKHLETKKHKILQKKHKILQNNNNSKKYTCECGKEYKHHSSLFNHKKKCGDEKIIEHDNKKDTFIDSNIIDKILKENDELLKQNDELLKQNDELLKQNDELKNLLVEQNKQMMHTFQDTILKLCKIGIIQENNL
jgi:hypothetical protein